MIDRSHSDRAGGSQRTGEAEVDQRLGRHAIALLQAAREAGDPALIAHAEAMAMAVGFALANRMSDPITSED